MIGQVYNYNYGTSSRSTFPCTIQVAKFTLLEGYSTYETEVMNLKHNSCNAS